MLQGIPCSHCIKFATPPPPTPRLPRLLPPCAAAKKLAINAWGNLESNSQGLSQGSAKLGLASDGLLAQRPVTGLAFCAGPIPLLLAAYAPVGAQLGAAALLQVRGGAGRGWRIRRG